MGVIAAYAAFYITAAQLAENLVYWMGAQGAEMNAADERQRERWSRAFISMKLRGMSDDEAIDLAESVTFLDAASIYVDWMYHGERGAGMTDGNHCQYGLNHGQFTGRQLMYVPGYDPVGVSSANRGSNYTGVLAKGTVRGPGSLFLDGRRDVGTAEPAENGQAGGMWKMLFWFRNYPVSGLTNANWGGPDLSGTLAAMEKDYKTGTYVPTADGKYVLKG
jgi:hypothetical protein